MINKNRTRFSRHLKQTGVACFLLLLVLLSVQETVAQPGDRRTPQQIRKDIENKIADIKQQMIDFPDRLWLNESRALALTELFRITQDRDERDSLAERAFADFDEYEELTKGSADMPRAELHQLVWMTEAPDPRNSELTNYTIEVFRHSPHFEAVVVVYRKIIRGLEQSTSYPGSDDVLRTYYATVANLFLFRALALTRIPGAVKAMYEPKLIWEDFDKAIELRKRSVEPSGSIFVVTDMYFRKGEAAYELGEYQIALDAYQASDEYMADGLKSCPDNHSTSCNEYLQNSYIDFVTLLKAKSYMKKGDYENAITNLTYSIAKGSTYASTCRHLFLMRAQAYRKLRRIDLALADQETASQLSDGCEL